MKLLSIFTVILFSLVVFTNLDAMHSRVDPLSSAQELLDDCVYCKKAVFSGEEFLNQELLPCGCIAHAACPIKFYIDYNRQRCPGCNQRHSEPFMKLAERGLSAYSAKKAALFSAFGGIVGSLLLEGISSNAIFPWILLETLVVSGGIYAYGKYLDCTNPAVPKRNRNNKPRDSQLV